MKKCLSVLGLCSVLLVAVSAQAQFGDSDEDLIGSAERSPASQAARRQYLGGRDEQDLQVQDSLPLPSRSPDGTGGSTEDSEAAHD